MTLLAVFAGVSALCAGGLGIGLALLLPAINNAREAAQKSQSKGHLKQMAVALHNYHDTYTTFPPSGTFSATNIPHHGWQTMILPFVDQVPLYNIIDHSVPWDDPRHRRAFMMPIPGYYNPKLTASADRFSPHGLALSHYAMNSQFGGPNKALKITDILDGTSNTIMVGEVGTGFLAWGDPANVRDPAPGMGAAPDRFGGVYKGGANFTMADGGVRFISDNIDPAVLKALSTPASKENEGPF